MLNDLQMKKYLTYLLCIVSTIGWAENSFDAFCSKFPLVELPIVSDSRIERYRNNESAPYQIDNYRIDSISGKIISETGNDE